MAALATVLSAPTWAQAVRAEANFEEALLDHSTSPYYVKIKLTDLTSGKSIDTCITANLFLGALHIEHAYPYTAAGIKAVQTFAISSRSRAFSFRSRKALENMPWHPSKAELSSGTAFVSGKPSLALRPDRLAVFYKGGVRERERMAAIACALLDRGLKPRLADLSGDLYVQE
jgi:hypothetical protein